MAAVVLGGGRNTRMGGRDKCLLVVRGRPLVVQILELLSGLFEEVVLVTNRPDVYRGSVVGVRLTEDRYKNCGPLGGLQAGLEACTRPAVLCVACDMPHLDPALIRRQAAEFQLLRRGRSPADVLLPRTGTLIEPLHGIYARELEPVTRELLEDGGGYSIRRLFARVRTRYLDLPDSPEVRRKFSNLNTPEDARLAAETEGS
jgi:molybdopterin-guanine dinucleotide biosynthesis protein A